MPNSPTLPRPSIAGTPQLITVDELSKLLGMSKRTVWRLLSVGQVPRPVRIGRSTRWRLDEVRRWIDLGCPGQDNRLNGRSSKTPTTRREF
jgi:excisionase family DNA binding protein